MANWAYKVDFKEFYHKYPDELSIQEVAEKVVESLNALLEEIRKEPEIAISIHRAYRSEFLDLAEELEYEIIPLFEEVLENEDTSEVDFDYAMNDLYDWGDISLDNNFGGVKMCWINTL